MLKNAFKIAVRNLRNNKAFTFLNIFGLTLGLASCLLILIYIVDELGYDRYNLNSDRIFRVNTDTKFGNLSTSLAITPPVIASTLVRNYAEVEKAVRLFPDVEKFRNSSDVIVREKVVYADPEVFDVFTLPMIAGDAKTALVEPNSIVITERIAKIYFNKTEVIGQTLTIMADKNTTKALKVTGVIGDIPRQSHFRFDFFLPMASLPLSQNKNFNSIISFHTYIRLRKGANYAALESKFPALIRKNLPFMEEMEKNGDYFRINLTPIRDIHLKSNRQNEIGVNGNFKYVVIFSGIAAIILFVACINFINLSVAQSFKRAREVVVRKVLGSSRKSLVFQFLLESTFVAIVATTLAMILAWALLPYFNQLAGTELTVTLPTLKWLCPSLLAIIAVVGLLAGSYPALFLSAFQPINILRARFSARLKTAGLRNALIIFQFSIAIFLIVSTLVIYNQLNFMLRKDLGFTRNQIVVVQHLSSLGNQSQIFKQEIKKLPNVVDATMSSFIPTSNRRWRNFLSTQSTQLQTEFWPVDQDYITTLGMQLKKGRGFSNNIISDSSAIVVNETAAKMLNIWEDPLNRKVSYGLGEKEYHIVGVVKDFNFSSLRDNITPLVMTMTTTFEIKKEGDEPQALCVRTSSNDLAGLLAHLEIQWKALAPHQQFEYSFMDEDFNSIYKDEQRIAKIFSAFTGLAIVIACLGLFGLASFMIKQRFKEISIRKVMGANVLAIVNILGKEYLMLIIISIAIAVPLSWWAMSKWLQDYAYRINIQWWLFAIAATGAVFMVLVSVCLQSIKAANANPVKNLRAE